MTTTAPATAALAQPPGHVRAVVHDALTQAQGFEQVAPDDRRTIANALVRIAHAAKLLEEESSAPAPARAAAPVARAMDAEEHYGGSAVEGMAGTTRRMLQAISFPRFVNELITGVFRAMVETNQQQLQQYVELVRGVSQSLDGFSSLGGSSDDPAKRWLAQQFPQSFAVEEPEPPDPRDVPDPEDEPEPVRLTTRGAPPSADAIRAALSVEPGTAVPTGAQELVPFVRASLARNRQQMLATMVQMGMQRIVIDSGRINASMRFHIDASSAAEEQSHSGFDTRTTMGASASGGFGLWSASASVNTTIGYVRTDDVATREQTNASADLNSSVELHFRTDQVPLDRIASEQTVERLRLNTLNPERELSIAAETDRARITADQAANTARAANRPPALAPTPPPPPPSAVDSAIGAVTGRSAGGAAGSGAGAGSTSGGGAAGSSTTAGAARTGAGSAPTAGAGSPPGGGAPAGGSGGTAAGGTAVGGSASSGGAAPNPPAGTVAPGGSTTAGTATAPASGGAAAIRT
ncbi:hypothetical protein [Sphingomonas alpina]|uniref:Uncharacterized protein n=1 Tax=Sphingomonas alpina TaxID=653931 RepID=A0A7H0LJ18_9SPHN|nr:hypothetical protein [Sphingomonas alpina]QNQ09671.1 hypothetical protein H3Z74_24135 [Sphingomonas alpina]